MKSEYLHLYLGLTRNELKRRIELGLIDPKSIEFQVNDYSTNIKLQALSEQWLEDHKADQVDQYSVADIQVISK